MQINLNSHSIERIQLLTIKSISILDPLNPSATAAEPPLIETDKVSHRVTGKNDMGVT